MAYRHTLCLSKDYNSETADAFASVSMAKFGLFELLREWWKIQGRDRQEVGERRSKLLIDTTIRLAVRSGYESYDDESLLSVACMRGQAAVVERLLDSWGKSNVIKIHERWKPSMLTDLVLSDDRSSNVCRILLEHGWNPNLINPERPYADRRQGPLFVASLKGDVELICLLLYFGADPNTGFCDPLRSPLAFAFIRGHLEAVQILIREGNASPPIRHDPTFIYRLAATAAGEGIPKGCLYLEKVCKIDVNFRLAPHESGEALLESSRYGRFADVDYLLAHGANINTEVRTNTMARSALVAWASTLLTVAAGVGKVDMLRYLVDRGAIVNMVCRDGERGCALTAALSAIQCHTARVWPPPVMKHLVEEAGADVNLELRTGIIDNNHAGRPGSCLAGAFMQHGPIRLPPSTSLIMGRE
jgi:hypothetical protein